MNLTTFLPQYLAFSLQNQVKVVAVVARREALKHVGTTRVANASLTVPFSS